MAWSSAAEFERVGRRIINKNNWYKRRYNRGQYKAIFGASPALIAFMWNKMNRKGVLGRARPKNFLWFLLFCKIYPSEAVGAALCGCTEKTMRKWFNFFLDAVPQIMQVSALKSNEMLLL